MPRNYEPLGDTGIEFKHLLSGPAQVGKILNYIMLAGQGSLKHQDGKRYDTFEGGLGNAWCLEFMVGLGLIRYERISEDSTVDIVRLTSSGTRINNILTENAISNPLYFDMGSNPQRPLDQLSEAGALNVVYNIEDAFRESIIFKDLRIFLGIGDLPQVDIEYVKSEFMEEFYGELCKFYTNEDYVYEGSGASTATNRVPSLIQLLSFLGYIEESRRGGVTYITFLTDAFRNGVYNESYSLDLSIEHLASEYQKEEEKIAVLRERYGDEGVRIVTSKARLSQAQLIFKKRLIREYGCNCCLCGIHNDELLIGSHIKDAALCNIDGKTDNNNGLLLCAMHDKLFDSRLITFMYGTGGIIVANRLDNHDAQLCNIDRDMVLPDNLMTEERKQYLLWHNHQFYLENN